MWVWMELSPSGGTSVFTVCVSEDERVVCAARGVCAACGVCAHLLHWTLDLGPDTRQALCDVCMWVNTMAHVGGQSCGFQGSNSSCQSWARPFDCWAIAAATPCPLKRVLYCLTELLRLTLNLQLCFLSCLSDWDYRSCQQAWCSCFTVDVSHLPTAIHD